MYIPPHKRTQTNSTTRRGPALDYLGRKPAPTSPNEDPYWTLRIDDEKREKSKKNK